MNGLCITDAEKWFGVTSKTLCYYERVGLLEAIRADNNNYRYYDDSEVERIKQIMLLRKMQISIKDIIRIYENEDMSTVVEVFVNRIDAIDDEVETLTELKRIANDFLQIMLKYVMEYLSEPDYDYWFFAGLTGDIFTQYYSFTNLSSDSASGYLAEDNPAQFYEYTFLKCGYAATFVSGAEV